MVLLTIVTVVKDDPAGLLATHESLAHQDRSLPEGFTWEWVVIDGSADSTEFSTDFDFSGEFHYERQTPSGIYPAMNHALTVASGEYILFLNAGDTLAASETLTRLATDLSNRPAWLFGRVLFFSRSGASLREREWSYHAEKRALFARGHFPPHQGTIMKTEELRRIGGFSPDLKLVADYEAMLKISEISDPVELTYPIAIFARGGASTVHWKHALKEFHRARMRVLQPQGVAKVKELFNTGIQTGKHIGSSIKSKIVR